jgi:hypothetical protein
MRLFQNSGIYPSYLPRLAELRKDCTGFANAIEIFLDDRFGAAHFLKPVLDGESSAFFANGDDPYAQGLWAVEQGLKATTPLDQILLAQVEHHRTEVFYNLDPMRYGNDFLARLPGHVRRTVAWRAAPSGGGNFLKHDVIVNNFPSILESYRSQGVRSEYLTPAHDPEMDCYAMRTERPIDILFVGGYSRHHKRRAVLLEAIAALRDEMNVAFHLDRSRLTRLAETPLGIVGPLARHKRPRAVRLVAQPPVFGRDLLQALSRSKMVINGAVDMAGIDRGNMRIWEALGCGAAMVSDIGRYPAGLKSGRDFLSYGSSEEAVAQLRTLYSDPEKRLALGRMGNETIRGHFPKASQWRRFVEIAS